METETAGSWASVRNGKWHRTVSEHPDFRRTEESVCGQSFRPVNVTWDERPSTHPAYICKHCERTERNA